MNRWDLIVNQFAGAQMAQFDDGDWVRYDDAKKMEDALMKIVNFGANPITNEWSTHLDDVVEMAKEGLS